MRPAVPASYRTTRKTAPFGDRRTRASCASIRRLEVVCRNLIDGPDDAPFLTRASRGDRQRLVAGDDRLMLHVVAGDDATNAQTHVRMNCLFNGGWDCAHPKSPGNHKARDGHSKQQHGEYQQRHDEWQRADDDI